MISATLLQVSANAPPIEFGGPHDGAAQGAEIWDVDLALGG